MAAVDLDSADARKNAMRRKKQQYNHQAEKTEEVKETEPLP